jgi:hypothetical protein
MNEELTAQTAEQSEEGIPADADVSGESRPAAERRTTLDCIASHPDLTPALREQLAELVQRQPPEEGSPKIALDDVLAILAETVPSTLRLNAGELPIAPHPEGESFFTGDPASDADKRAAAVASEQLALSGLLRKP